MRLIDVDRLTDGKGVFNGVIQYDGGKDGWIYLGDLVEVLDNSPTAYDVDKVIEQLKEEGCIVDNAAGNRAEEIIRTGGTRKMNAQNVNFAILGNTTEENGIVTVQR